MNLSNMEKFLKDAVYIYNRIPKKEKTFMEVSGYPHYENVCSNILSFYFNPNEEHRLNDTVLKSLLSTIDKKQPKLINNISTDNISVYREYTTLKGNRIDIVIKNDDFVIGIENKIYASVYNDLDDYAKTLDSINKNSIKVLLSLHNKNDIAIQKGFVNVTYNELFDNLMEKLDNVDTTNKWYIYLVDFIASLKGYKVETEMEQEINEWIKNNKENINNFLDVIKIYKDNILKKSEEYDNLMEKKVSNCKIKHWTGDYLSVISYIVLDLGCNLDVSLGVDGWDISINMWKKSKRDTIKNNMLDNGYNIIKEEDGHIWLYNFDYDCDTETVVNKVFEVFKILNTIEG